MQTVYIRLETTAIYIYIYIYIYTHIYHCHDKGSIITAHKMKFSEHDSIMLLHWDLNTGHRQIIISMKSCTNY